MTRRFALMMALLLGAAMMMSAQAMPIHIEEGSFTATATAVEDASSVELDITDFQLLGKNEAGDYLILSDGQYLTVSRGDMAGVISSIGAQANTLPSVTDFEELSRGAKGAAVTALQNALVTLGQLRSADGDFGGNSQRAISAIQRENGLKQTGVADPLTQMLVYSSAAEPMSIIPVVDPEVAFASIIGKTEADLTKVVEMGLTLDYDDIAGEGMISNGNSVYYSVPVANDIDKAAFTVTFGLHVKQGDDGIVDVRPAMTLNCQCIRRPVMQDILLKSGDERRTQAVSDLSTALSGVESVETALVFLDEDAVNLIANAAEEGELKLRVEGKYNNFDIVIPMETLEALSNVAKAAQGL